MAFDYKRFSRYSIQSVTIKDELSQVTIDYKCPCCQKHTSVTRPTTRLRSAECLRVPCANVICGISGKTCLLTIRGRDFDSLDFEIRHVVVERPETVVPGPVQYYRSEAAGLALGLSGVLMAVAKATIDHWV